MTYILLGAAAMLCFLICLGLSAYIGYKLGKKQKPTELTQEQKLALERRQKAWEAIMNYNLDTAMGRKVK